MSICPPDRSRLGCQIIASKELDGLRIRIPSASRNFYVSAAKGVTLLGHHHALRASSRVTLCTDTHGQQSIK